MFVYLEFILAFITKHLGLIRGFLLGTMKTNNNNNNNSHKKTRSSARLNSNDDKTATNDDDSSRPKSSDQAQVITTSNDTEIIVKPLSIHCLSTVEELRNKYPDLTIMGMAPKKK